MEHDWDEELEEYEEGEEHFYDDEGAFGVGLPPRAGSAHEERTRRD
ncbi:hypothetical protein KGD83_25900 [Nocardiopsis akebiae]|uniref:Uncharacterized protein n=1 Tax=Nocardiopsis akebiae TaxID=2831968 RepID=A0ABX8C670_9ACTN|nr:MULTISPECIES: hypothetical protein [Nocardiopsis]QUX28611.1 hypothetical protein KGD83_25900 [Nocardiopsis akebiae]